jgi:hypothetical protein
MADPAPRLTTMVNRIDRASAPLEAKIDSIVARPDREFPALAALARGELRFNEEAATLAGPASDIPPETFLVALTEPGTGEDSDVLDLQHAAGSTSYSFLFLSPAEGGPGLGLGPGVPRTPETGELQDVSAFLPTALFDFGFRVSVQPDVEQVPEPASIALVGLGIAELGALLRRRRQNG